MSDMNDALALRRRPWNVTVVTILGLLLSAGGFIMGASQVAFSGSGSEEIAEGMGQTALIVSGLVFVIGGALMFILWIFFFRGARIARTILAVLVVLHVVAALLGALGRPSAATWGTFIGEVVLEAIVLSLMYAGQRTAAFFAKA